MFGQRCIETTSLILSYAYESKLQVCSQYLGRATGLNCFSSVVLETILGWCNWSEKASNLVIQFYIFKKFHLTHFDLLNIQNEGLS